MTAVQGVAVSAASRVLYLAERVWIPTTTEGQEGEQAGTLIDGGAGVLVVDGLVRAVGRARDLAPAEASVHVIDFGDATLTPGLIDAHSHPIWGLEMIRGCDLAGADTLEEVITRLRTEQEGLADDEWLFGYGLDPAVFDGPITNDFLTEAAGASRAAWVTMFDAHSAIVSDESLRIAGVTAGVTFADGSEITSRPDGRPSGYLLEFSAIDTVRPFAPTPPIEEQAERLSALFDEMAATGITQVHALDLRTPNALEMLETIEHERDLPVRLRISPWCEPRQSDDEVDATIAKIGTHGRRWRVEGMKFFIDGTIDGGSAWLEHPDSQGECLGSTWSDPELYARRIRQCHEAGIATATHAIGDRGVRYAAETLATLDGSITHRIEHLEVVADEVIELMAKHGIVASMQPTHCTLYTDPYRQDTWSERLGDERVNLGWRIGDVRRGGVTVALGSDWPIAPFDPRGTIADAALRRRHNEPDSLQIGPEQAISVSAAIESASHNGARSIDWNGGSLEVGSAADFTVFAGDPFAIDPQAFADIPVMATVVEGRIAYRRG